MGAACITFYASRFSSCEMAILASNGPLVWIAADYAAGDAAQIVAAGWSIGEVVCAAGGQLPDLIVRESQRGAWGARLGLMIGQHYVGDVAIHLAAAMAVDQHSRVAVDPQPI